MAELKAHLGELGLIDVKTYINSGNIIVSSDKSAKQICAMVEEAMVSTFGLNPEINKVLVLLHDQLKAVADAKPKGFGEDPKKYYSDAIFLLDFPLEEALEVFDPREGVDAIWPGKDVIYYQRLGAERTKSKLGKIIGTKPYKSMTIRSWNTVVKLLALMDERS